MLEMNTDTFRGACSWITAGYPSVDELTVFWFSTADDEWRLESLVDASGYVFELGYLSVGIHEITMIVSDGTHQVSSDSVIITILEDSTE